MIRTPARWTTTLGALLGLMVVPALADDPKPAAPPALPKLPFATVQKSPSFYDRVLAPKLDARLSNETAAALDFARRSANPWTHDTGLEERVEKGAIRATTGAMKRYALDRLQLDGWSLPLVGGSGTGLAALRNDAGGTRLRFGIAHMAPRAEVLVPSDHGRFGVSLDARGRIGASFEAPASSLRFGIALDPVSRDATLGLIRRF